MIRFGFLSSIAHLKTGSVQVAAARAVAGRIGSSCAGWARSPTPEEFYDAVCAERPSERQKAVVLMWVTEATTHEIYERAAIYAGAGRAYAEVATLDGYEATFDVGGYELSSRGLYDHIEALTGDAEGVRERIATACEGARAPTRVWASRLGRPERR